jgi:hypothetical protein
MVIGNFEKIEENIKEYKDLNFLLGELQSKLEEVLQSLKKERKNPLSTQGVNKQIATSIWGPCPTRKHKDRTAHVRYNPILLYKVLEKGEREGGKIL